MQEKATIMAETPAQAVETDAGAEHRNTTMTPRNKHEDDGVILLRQDLAATIEDLKKTTTNFLLRQEILHHHRMKLQHQQHENILRRQDKKLKEMIDEMRLLAQDMMARAETPAQAIETDLQANLNTTMAVPDQDDKTTARKAKKNRRKRQKKKKPLVSIKSTTEENHTLLLPKKPKWLYPLPRAPSCKRTN